MNPINENTISTAGYEFDQIDPNIYVIKNFLTEDECNYFYDLAESKTHDDWFGAYLEGIKDRSEARHGTRDLEESKLEVTHDWNDKVIAIGQQASAYRLDERLAKLFDPEAGYSFRSFGIIQRQYTGAELRGHYDQYVDNRMQWAAVIYINDNYTDGELYFSKRGIQIKPPRKSVVVFPATEEYWHGVNAVGDGPVRYAMPSFVWTEPDIF